MKQKYYLVVTPFFPDSTSFRGPYIYDQVKAIASESDYEVIVFKPFNFYGKEEDYTYEGVNVYRFPVYNLPSSLLPGVFDYFSAKSFVNKISSLGININQIQVVHTHTIGLCVFANAIKSINPNIKSINQVHGFDVLAVGNGILKYTKFQEKYMINYGKSLYNKLDLLVGVSKKTIDQFDKYPGFEIRDRYVLFNGIDKSKFYTTDRKKNDSSQFTIGCIANFWFLKDQITLLKAIKLLVDKGCNNILCRFIGSGITLDSCKKYVEDNSLSKFVSFETEVFHDKLVDFYNTLDLFVLPSYYEAFGCVYTEAYACGVPFIAVYDQGIEELLDNEIKDDWLIKKGDYARLFQLIERQIVSPKEMNIDEQNIYISPLVKKFIDYIQG